MPDADWTNNDDRAGGPHASPRSDQAAGKDSPDDLASEFMRFHFGERAGGFLPVAARGLF